MLKRVICVLVLCGAMFGIVGATPALAANCSVSVGNTYYTGAWQSDTVLYNCTGVSGVQMAGSGGPGPNGIYAYLAWAGWHPTYTTNAQNLTSLPTYTYTQRVGVFGYGCGSPGFPVSWTVHYRIRNAFGNTWGSWYAAQGPVHHIC